jgi:hypothetical protein
MLAVLYVSISIGVFIAYLLDMEGPFEGLPKTIFNILGNFVEAFFWPITLYMHIFKKIWGDE